MATFTPGFKIQTGIRLNCDLAKCVWSGFGGSLNVCICIQISIEVCNLNVVWLGFTHNTYCM